MLTARYSDLFRNITQNCRPIAIKTRKFSKSDQVLIKAETDRLLKEIRIKKSNSLWRAQTLEVDNGKRKRRICNGCSCTINYQIRCLSSIKYRVHC